MKLSCLVWLSICTTASLLANVRETQAQLTPDGTVNTQVNQNGNVSEITGGETRGSNLFHSFREFSVRTGNEAFFNNAAAISNIFSRVTGGDVSNIDGLIRANGSASLFLINPAGIVFGENARLDLGGSFYASSASSILFEDGEFSAVDNLQQPILTVNAPVGLSFRDEPGDITVRNDGNGARFFDSEVIDTQNALRVDSDATISFIGGNLLFEDATVKTAGGRIELGSVAAGIVDLVAVNNGFSFDYSNIESFSDISLSGRSIADASGIGGGDIQAVGNNIFLTGLSGFAADTLGSETGGDINVFASDSIEISGVANELNFVSAISNRVFPTGTADAGDINIETGSLQIGDRAFIGTTTLGPGNAGNININASDSITLESQGNTSAIASNVAEGAIGDGGGVDITTSSLTLSNGAFINANTSGQGSAGNVTVDANSLFLTAGSLLSANANSSQGDAGSIIINASETVSLSGAGSGFFTNVRTNETVGNGGNIEIAAGSLTIGDRASLNATSSGQGNAGNVTVNASDSIAVEGSDPNSSFNTEIDVSSSSEGEAGNIELNTGSLTLNNGAGLDTGNIANSTAGDVTINALEDIAFSNSSNINVTGAAGGSIAIDARNLSITSSSVFFAGIPSRFGSPEAQAGGIIVNLTEDLVMDGLDSEGLTFITNTNFGTGDAGSTIINARNITFANGGSISSFNSGEGDIGDITLNAEGDIAFDGIKGSQQSGIQNFVNSQGTGDVGEININGQNLTLTNGALIQSLVAGNADSGDININIADTISVDGFGTSSILASSISSVVGSGGIGNSGNINIDTQNLFLSRNGEVNTSIFGRGNAGNININAELITIGEQGNPNLSTSSIDSTAFGDVESSIEEVNAGNVTIETGSLLISDGASVGAGVFQDSIGDGGNISITATDTVAIDGTGFLGNVELASNINADIGTGSVGNGGNIEIDANNLSLSGAAFISADILSNSVGNGGNIEINANNLSLSGAAFISADVFTGSDGDGGSINITATDLVKLSNFSFIEAIVLEDAVGNSGNLSITTERLSLDGGSQISATTFGAGNAGNLNIRAANSIELSGFSEARSGLFVSALVGSGNGGNLSISTNQLRILDGATINVSNFQSRNQIEPGTGTAGELNIQANSVSLDNDSIITAATQSGEGGNISITTSDNLILSNNSTISAEAFNNANGGNIDIITDFIIAFPSSGDGNDIIASAELGDGGNIRIDAESLFGIAEGVAIEGNGTNDIDASSEFGLAGTVSIIFPDADVLQSGTELPRQVIEPQETTTQACAAERDLTARNTLIVKGRGGIPPKPEAPLDADNIIIDGELAATPHPEIEPIETADGSIIPARGVIKTDDSRIVLTAYPTDNPQRIPDAVSNCNRS